MWSGDKITEQYAKGRKWQKRTVFVVIATSLHPLCGSDYHANYDAQDHQKTKDKAKYTSIISTHCRNLEEALLDDMAQLGITPNAEDN